MINYNLACDDYKVVGVESIGELFGFFSEVIKTASDN